jgi:hypothetical protein
MLRTSPVEPLAMSKKRAKSVSVSRSAPSAILLLIETAARFSWSLNE